MTLLACVGVINAHGHGDSFGYKFVTKHDGHHGHHGGWGVNSGWNNGIDSGYGGHQDYHVKFFANNNFD